MYFWITTLVQRFSEEISFQLKFSCKGFGEKWMFFRPQPPRAFGVAMVSHLTHGNTKLSLEPAHKKFETKLSNFFQTPFGIHAKDIQYTGMASRTDLTNTNRPALDNHLKLHTFNIFSNFSMSQDQSSFL
jgi:hypothetical protein